MSNKNVPQLRRVRINLNERDFAYSASGRSSNDNNKSVIGTLPETRTKAIFSESEFDSLDKDDFKDLFKARSMIFHPHYMVTSIEGMARLVPQFLLLCLLTYGGVRETCSDKHQVHG